MTRKSGGIDIVKAGIAAGAYHVATLAIDGADPHSAAQAVLSTSAMSHPLLAELPDNKQGQSVRSPREAMRRASLAATHARDRGSVDADGCILVEAQDLDATA